MTLRPTSLWHRTLFFILLPTFLLLLGMSTVCYVFVRDLLLRQWGETAIAELQRTAHHIDMRLRQPKDLLNILKAGKEPAGVDQEILSHILQQIEGLDGVVGVNLNKPGNGDQRDLFDHVHSSAFPRPRAIDDRPTPLSPPTGKQNGLTDRGIPGRRQHRTESCGGDPLVRYPDKLDT